MGLGQQTPAIREGAYTAPSFSCADDNGPGQGCRSEGGEAAHRTEGSKAACCIDGPGPGCRSDGPGHACRIARVAEGSAAWRAGLRDGMRLLSADGCALRDILDWHWLADGEELAVESLDLRDGVRRSTVMRRAWGEPWGIEFADAIFDGVRLCRNSCVFCFMDMLPDGMRQSLYLKDDDYRLSFLHGNFVTLTNVSDAELRRIIEMHLSPLRMSLHAVSADVRARLMGRRHARGIEVLERLLAAGIEIMAQLVVVPGVNDGIELERTLAWIAERPGISATGIVPYAFTRHARIQEQLGAAGAAGVLDAVARCDGLRRSDGARRVMAADELHLAAGMGAGLATAMDSLPPASSYGEYPLLEDGVGMLREFIDDWRRLAASEAPCGLDCGREQAERMQKALAAADEAGVAARMLLVTGEAFAPILRELLGEAPGGAPGVSVIAVENRFFGGCVDVAGLLTGHDIIEQASLQAGGPSCLAVLPSVIFNDDLLTLDDLGILDIEQGLGCGCIVIDCNAEALHRLLKAWLARA
jgi:putative radical SAM enzyme (TIGR03279 family)